MKKLLTLMIATVLLLGCVNVTAFAETHTESITISAIVAPVSYVIEVPKSVEMKEPGVMEIGTPKVKLVQNASSKTVISYTVTFMDFTHGLDSETMQTTYYSDSNGTTVFPTTAIEVYKNGDYVDPVPTIYVGVTEDDWFDATPGMYTATLSFTFKNENMSLVPISEIIGADFPQKGASNIWRHNSRDDWGAWKEDDKLRIGALLIPLTEVVTPIDGGYRYNGNGFTVDFNMTDSSLTSIVQKSGQIENKYTPQNPGSTNGG